MRWLIILSLVLSACGTEKEDARRTKNDLSAVVEKSDFYLSKISTVQGADGFLKFGGDSLGFTALAWGAGMIVDIEKARDTTGLWHRTTTHDCYPLGTCGSEQSKDHIIMLEIGSWLRGRLDIIKQVYNYGHSRSWVYGLGPIDRTYLVPPFQNTLKLLLGKRTQPPDFLIDTHEGYQRHFVALDIVLRAEVQGFIRADRLKILKDFRASSPHNALFQYGYHRFTDGNQAQTIDILLNTRWFPLDRLPTSADRCSRWLWERDESGVDWRPCPKDDVIHSGADLSFIVALLKRSYNE